MAGRENRLAEAKAFKVVAGYLCWAWQRVFIGATETAAHADRSLVVLDAVGKARVLSQI